MKDVTVTCSFSKENSAFVQFSMFLTPTDFNCNTYIKFESNALKKYENLSKELNDGLKNGNSIYLGSYQRTVVEDENFWKKVGNLLSSKDKIEILKYS